MGYLLLRSPIKYDFSHDYLLLKRLELILITVAPNLFLFFLISFFAVKTRFVHILIYSLGMSAVLLLLILPENKYWTMVLENWLQPQWFLLMAAVVWILLQNWNSHPDGKPMAISILLVFLTLLYDLLVSRQIVPLKSVYFIGQYSFLFYIISTSWILSKRYSKMFNQMEASWRREPLTSKKPTRNWRDWQRGIISQVFTTEWNGAVGWAGNGIDIAVMDSTSRSRSR